MFAFKNQITTTIQMQKRIGKRRGERNLWGQGWLKGNGAIPVGDSDMQSMVMVLTRRPTHSNGGGSIIVAHLWFVGGGFWNDYGRVLHCLILTSIYFIFLFFFCYVVLLIVDVLEEEEEYCCFLFLIVVMYEYGEGCCCLWRY